MSIFITGDIHGEIDIRKLGQRNFNSYGLTKNDYLIICGDFGLIWSWPSSPHIKEELYWLNWLHEKPFTTLFVDGNHENFDRLNAYDIENWHGGKIHRIGESIIHLMRGQIFDIDGKTFLTMGGAQSHDMEYRTEGLSWWREELPNYAEAEELGKSMADHDYKVDYIISHCAPTSLLTALSNGEYDTAGDAATNLLEQIESRVDYKMWFMGHYHTNKLIDDKHWELYTKIVDLDKLEYVQR